LQAIAVYDGTSQLNVIDVSQFVGAHLSQSAGVHVSAMEHREVINTDRVIAH